MLDDLIRCRRIEQCRLHVFCDGPKHADDAARVFETRRTIRRRLSAHRAAIVERDQNFGLMKSIIAGVSEISAHYGRVIVVEDDLRLGAGFVDFMLRALDRYEHATDVYQISGYMFPVAHPPQPDCFFLPLVTAWGWATWDRAWRALDRNPTDVIEALADPGLQHRFNLDGSYPYDRLLRDRLDGRNESWDILWAWSVFRAGGLALHPRESLVHNAGFDGSGTHCGARRDSRQDQAVDVRELGIGESITFPERVEADMKAFARITAHLGGTRGRKEMAECR
jgi:hypothetical protein